MLGFGRKRKTEIERLRLVEIAKDKLSAARGEAHDRRYSFSALQARVDRIFSGSDALSLRDRIIRAREEASLAEVNQSYVKRYLWLATLNSATKWTHKATTDDENLNRDIEEAFLDFCEKGSFEITGRGGFEDTLFTAVAHLLREGEIFFIEHFGRNSFNEFGYSVQLVNPSLCDIDLNTTAANGNKIVHGIEINNIGRPVAYYFSGGKSVVISGRSYNRYPASRVIHAFPSMDSSHIRGIPFTESSIDRLKKLSAYEDAALEAASYGARKQGFYQQKEALHEETPDRGKLNSIDDVEKLSVEDLTALIAKSSSELSEIVNGLHMTKIPEGHEFVGFDPAYPAGEYVGFSKAQTKSAATALNVAYFSLSGDLSDTSYSSARVGLIGERDFYEYLQRFLKRQVIQRIYRNWFTAIAYRDLVDGVNLATYQKLSRKARFEGKKFDWVDPWREVRALKELVDMDGIELDKIARQQGYGSIEEVIKQKKRIMDFAQNLGVPLSAYQTEASEEDAKELDSEDV